MAEQEIILGNDRLTVQHQRQDGWLVLSWNGQTLQARLGQNADQQWLELREEDGRVTRYPASASRLADGSWHLWLDGRDMQVQLPARGAASTPARAADGTVAAPMTGLVRQVMVREGEQVKAGQVLAVMEAMKMELPLTAPMAGIVTKLTAMAGNVVSQGTVLMVVETHD